MTFDPGKGLISRYWGTSDVSCPEPAAAIGGPACPSDQTQVFTAAVWPLGIMLEISGVKLAPIATVDQSSQNGPPYQTTSLDPGAGLFAAMVLAGFTVAIGDGETGPSFGSATLITDFDQSLNDAGGHSPEVFVGHRIISLPVGAYNSIIATSLANRNWCGSAMILASDGRLPTIVQSVGVNDTTTTLTLPAAPRLGNLLACYLGSRVGSSAISPPSGSWTSLTKVTCPDAIFFGTRSGRWMFKEVCT